MRFLHLALLAFGLLLSGQALAVQPDEVLPDTALEGRARELSRELRCMVCQNQSIDDSEAPLARDLRILVRERLRLGDSNQQVLDYLVARYGEFVLLKPRFNTHNLLLWLVTPGVLVAGAIALLVMIRRRTGQAPATAAADAKLTAAEQEQLAKLMKSSEG